MSAWTLLDLAVQKPLNFNFENFTHFEVWKYLGIIKTLNQQNF